MRGAHLFSVVGRKAVLAQVESIAVRTALTHLYQVLDQSVVAQHEAGHQSLL